MVTNIFIRIKKGSFMNHNIIRLTTGLAISLFALSVQAFTVVNATKSALTISINEVCQKFTLGSDGITDIPDNIVANLCGNFASPCTIEGHDMDACGGKSLGGVIYSAGNAFKTFGGNKNNISVGATKSTLAFTEMTY